MNSALKAMKTLKKRKAVHHIKPQKLGQSFDVAAMPDQNRMDRMIAGLVPHNQTLNRLLMTFDDQPQVE